ncbi:MAG: DsrE/DsrF/DrsH-like family protein [Rhodospirillales bacterium]|nr:DsrE/DsrF/DrsH-like family protein [Rhodospirillales bacterium]
MHGHLNGPPAACQLGIRRQAGAFSSDCKGLAQLAIAGWNTEPLSDTLVLPNVPTCHRQETSAMSGDNAIVKQKQMTIIVTKGTLDWAYPPFILATTAAAMNVGVSMFFTFYGLQLLKRDVGHLQLSTLGNPGMEMPLMGRHLAMPNLVSALPGMDAACTTMMKNLIKRKGVASIAELREAALDLDVEMIGCQMTMDLFEWTADDLIDGIVIGGAATYMEKALASDINLFI